MSKMDQMRAMREASYAARASGAAPTRGSVAGRPTIVAAPTAPPAVARQAAPAAAAPDEVLCGHRNMSGRTCTREQGHAAKSHRYS